MNDSDRKGAGDAEDPTELRPERTASEQTRLRSGNPVTTDDDETTRMREQVAAAGRAGRPAEEDVTEATVFRAVATPADPAGSAEDAAALRPTAGDDATGPTVLRERQPSASEIEMPGDDDPTLTTYGSTLGADDDPTVQVAPEGDEDPTIRSGMAQVDDDPTTRIEPPVGDDDVTEPVTPRSGVIAGDDPTVQIRADAADSAAPPAALLGIGTVLKGRFVLEDKLGEGGMGGVYKAVDLVKQEARDRNPHVAVKVLNENFAEHPDAFIALQRESSRTQRLSHPNIASVYDFDRDGRTAYMVMELMQGDPLDKFLKKNKAGAPKEQAFSIIKDIASALAYAHAQGLIHSDFKPGNIFLTESGTAKVFDFGIARAASAPGDDKAGPRPRVSSDTLATDDDSDKTLFDAGELGALTPAYAACEMFEGKEPAPQDDVYALGIVAYQCLTGRHPFDRKKALIAEAQERVPERPEGLTRRQWNALRHALAFRREERTPDAQAFLEAFFGIAGSGIRYALLGAAGVAAVVAGLYFGGVIGPGAAPIEVPREWVELDTRIEDARASVQEQLAGAVFGPVWEEFVQRDLRRWAESATPVVVAGRFETQDQAEGMRRRVFEQLDIPLRVETPERSGDGYRLLAGPFSGAAADTTRARTLQRLREFGMDAREEGDAAAIDRARDQALEVYLDQIERLVPQGDPPPIPTIRDEEAEAFVPEPERLEAARSVVLEIREAQEVLARAISRYPTRPELLMALDEALTSLRTQWQGHVDRAIATASSRQAEEERAELLAQQQAQAEAERQRAYEDMRDDRVFPVFAGRCHRPDEIRGALAEFEQLTAADRQEALDYAAVCADSRVTRSPVEVMQSRAKILAVASHDGLAAVEPPDPCSSRIYVGNGRTTICRDELADGSRGPDMVVVPARNDSRIYAISKYEISVAEFNRFCEATGCTTPAVGAPRLPATGIPVTAAEDYAVWLSEQTELRYRLPTVDEWHHAADAQGSALDGNRNCYSNVRGVIRGEGLIPITQGAPNDWGLINHVGNAQEWAWNGQALMVVGGKHTDSLSECTVETRAAHDGSADPATGFRLVREIH